jgi:quercetin dioxygenase-like cupin family protein
MMRSFHVCAIAVAAALGGSLATLGAQKQMQRSTVFEWASLEAKPTQTGVRRDVMRAPTPTLDELEMHITTLNPHTASHKPHTHPNEEMVIVKEGTLQAHVNGKEIVVPAGGVLFFASMQPHAVQNIGATPATYYVINWASPGMKAKKQIPAPPTGPAVQ